MPSPNQDGGVGGLLGRCGALRRGGWRAGKLGGPSTAAGRSAPRLKAMACVTSRSRCRASRYSFRGSLTLKSSAKRLHLALPQKRGLSKVPRMRGHTCLLPQKRGLFLASLDAGRPERTYLLPQKGACAGVPGCREACSHLLVLRPPLGLPDFKCVQPGLEALAHPHSTLVR